MHGFKHIVSIEFEITINRLINAIEQCCEALLKPLKTLFVRQYSMSILILNSHYDKDRNRNMR